jgi:hypothetical protein
MSNLLRAYVDETGDRGCGGKSSPFFAFAAVLVGDEDEPQLRAAISGLRREFGIPVGKALHWKDHAKAYPRRQHIARTLSSVKNLVITYVVVEKAAIPPGSGMRRDHEIFYNYAAGLTMERLLLAANGWPGGGRNVLVRFGHVRGFDHTKTTSYFASKRRTAPPDWPPWHRLHGAVHFNDQASWDGLQAADQYAGMLNTALRRDDFGGYEQMHLLKVRHQLRRDPQGNAWGWGFKVLGNNATITSLPWWPAVGL